MQNSQNTGTDIIEMLLCIFVYRYTGSGPKVIKRFSCSTQVSMKKILLINLKLLINANSYLLDIAEHEHFSANKYENANYC